MYIQPLHEIRASLAGGRSQGVEQTLIPSVRFFWGEQHVARTPLVYPASIVLVGQGSKTGYLGESIFNYNENNYLVVALPTPFECETFATPENPLLGIIVDIEPVVLGNLLEVYTPTPPLSESLCGVAPAVVSGSMQACVDRLIACLQNAEDCRVIGRELVRELIYHVLKGPHGAMLAKLAVQSRHNGTGKAISFIHHHYEKNLSVEKLACIANMSPSVFHRTFKAVTGSSPLRYLKEIRLNKAKSLLVHERLPISTVLKKVGYKSTSQFSREFKNYFGHSPSAAAKIAYSYIKQ
ncbi:AraC family transcriptional regulator [Craterilacuibacter sinensis]|uniref:Helix-turn-helix domain-containing protein n=1 Tax=Craterilacuibacter sinensis TaxID=2686017 RepID=A0A845BNC7_9NEIS|nr:AraC family transcriptional regulator [Craterilacuibacter sinensis]MXR37779.1 helix-turn-helix domain-containing protein [Craterilacuibacter sinensis]